MNYFFYHTNIVLCILFDYCGNSIDQRSFGLERNAVAERERERRRESSVFRERVSLLCTLSPVGREERRYNNRNILVLLNTY